MSKSPPILADSFQVGTIIRIAKGDDSVLAMITSIYDYYFKVLVGNSIESIITRNGLREGYFEKRKYTVLCIF